MGYMHIAHTNKPEPRLKGRDTDHMVCFGIWCWELQTHLLDDLTKNIQIHESHLHYIHHNG